MNEKIDPLRDTGFEFGIPAVTGLVSSVFARDIDNRSIEREYYRDQYLRNISARTIAFSTSITKAER